MEGRGRDVWIYMTCPALPRKMVGNSPRTGISFFPILGAAMAGRNRPRSEVPVIPTRPRTRRQPNDAAPKIPPSSRPSRPVSASTPRLRTRRPPANCLPLDLLFQIGACTTQAWPQNGKSPPSHVLHALLVLFHAGFLRPFKGRLVQQPIPSWLAPAPGNPANVSGQSPPTMSREELDSGTGPITVGNSLSTNIPSQAPLLNLGQHTAIFHRFPGPGCPR